MANQPKPNAAPEAPVKSAADTLLDMQLAEAQKRAINPLAIVSDEELSADDVRRNDCGAKSASVKTYANGSTVTRWK